MYCTAHHLAPQLTSSEHAAYNESALILTEKHMEQSDFHEKENERIKKTLNELDVKAPALAEILRKHVKPEDQLPHAPEKKDEPRRDPWGVGASLPTEDL